MQKEDCQVDSCGFFLNVYGSFKSLCKVDKEFTAKISELTLCFKGTCGCVELHCTIRMCIKQLRLILIRS